ncbi:MAG: homoserine dehydrogenase [Synergistales bacterium]|nr:homoserine dehydrogenase [Synergistales bacterium]
MRLNLLGLGRVGRGFVEHVLEKHDAVARQYGCAMDIVAVATRSRGGIYREAGLRPEQVLQWIDVGNSLRDELPPDTIFDLAVDELIEHQEYDVLVESTVTNLVHAEPAATYMKTALQRGKHVVTTNKGPVALHFPELSRLAAERGVCFLFEGTVLSGTPLFSFVRHGLRGSRIFSFEGVVSGTCNYMLSLMAKGASFDEALVDAQRMGITEANPSLDVDGWEAAAKAAIISQVLMGAEPLDIRMLPFEGIRHVTPQMIQEARRSGRCLRHVARVERLGEGVDIAVKPVMLPKNHPLSILPGNTNGALFFTDTLGEVYVSGAGAGARQTGYALFQDVLSLPG